GITRTINGSDDINLNRIPGSGGAYTAFPFYDDIQIFGDYPYMSQQDVINVHTSFGNGSTLKKPSFYSDMQPDIFEVSIFGKSYTFRFEKRVGTSNTLNTHIFNNNLAIINYDLNNRSFTLIDENGFEFYFSTKDYSTSFTSSRSNNLPSSSIREQTLVSTLDDPFGHDDGTTTSWLLDKITSPYGNELNFNYKSGIYASQPSYFGTVKIDEHYQLTGTDVNHPSSFIHNPSYSSTISIIETNYLESITGEFGTIEFISDQRKDLMSGSDLAELPGLSSFEYQLSYHDGNLTGSSSREFSYTHGNGSQSIFNYTTYKLNQIKIRDFNSILVKEVNLYNSYFNAHKLNHVREAEFLRLKLDSISVNDKKYSFLYEQQNNLPSKLSDDIDFWGFYNGANNSTNVPSIGRFITSEYMLGSATGTLVHSYINFEGASRKSNFNYGKYGILKTITYPTGGYTNLSYEAHDAVVEVTQPYHFTNSLSNGRPQWTNLKDEDLYNFTYLYLKNANDINYNFFNNQVNANSNPNGNGTPVPIISYATAEFETNVPAIIKVEADLDVFYGDLCLDGWAGYPRYIIQDKYDENIYYTVFTYDDFEPFSSSPVSKTKSVFVPPGDYEIKLVEYWPYPAGNCGVAASFVGSPTITLYDDFSNGDYLERFEIGGARVKKITNYSNDASFVSSKEFDYDIPNITNPNYSSSGKLMDDLTYFSKTFGYYSYSPRYGNSHGGNISLSSNSTIRNSPSAQGSHIGYSFVTEMSVDQNGFNLGSIERTYENIKNTYFKESFDRCYIIRESTNGTCPYNVSIDNALLTGMSPRVDWGHSNGNLLTERVYNRAGELLKLTVNDYNPININPDNNYYANFQGSPMPVGNNDQPYIIDGETFTVYQLNS
ncbi:MAG: hypothetical protein ACWA5P_05230, partial [bacterium]